MLWNVIVLFLRDNILTCTLKNLKITEPFHVLDCIIIVKFSCLEMNEAFLLQFSAPKLSTPLTDTRRPRDGNVTMF